MVFPNRLFGAYSIALGPFSSCQLRALRTSVTHLSLRRFFLPHTQSRSATTLAHEPITHASTINSTAKLIMHRHVLIALLCFHWPTLADTLLRFSRCISTYSNGPLNPPRIIAATLASTRVRRWCWCRNRCSPSPNATRCLPNYLSTAGDRKRQITKHVRRMRARQQLAAQ